MRPSSLLLLTAALVGTAGCSPKEPGQMPAPSSATFVEVRNDAFLNMNIYLVRGSARYKLGDVSGNSTRMFEVPRNFVNPGLPVRFQADPIGSNRAAFSQEITLYPGDRLTIRIPPG